MIRIVIEGMTKNRGGKETYIINMYKALKDEFQISFIAYDETIAYEDYLTGDGAAVYHLPARKNGLLKHKKALADLFETHKVDVLWAHKVTLSACESLVAAKQKGVPVRLIHSHGSDNTGTRFTAFMHNRNKARLSNWANGFFACSTEAAQWFYGDKPSLILKNGIDIGTFTFSEETRCRMREALGVGESFVIGHTGRFSKEKNQQKLVKAFAAYRDKDPDARLVLCGDGPTKKDVENLIAELGLAGSVILPGVVTNVPDYLMAEDLYVMPSLFEGLPFAILEAEASGLRCLVSDTISRESDVLGTNVNLPLEADDEVWADTIDDMRRALRKDRIAAAADMRAKGFDASDNAAQVSRYIREKIAGLKKD